MRSAAVIAWLGSLSAVAVAQPDSPSAPTSETPARPYRLEAEKSVEQAPAKPLRPEPPKPLESVASKPVRLEPPKPLQREARRQAQPVVTHELPAPSVSAGTPTAIQAPAAAPTPASPPPMNGSVLGAAPISAVQGRMVDLMERAAALVAQGNLSKAMDLYDEALSIDPRYPEAYRRRALALMGLGNPVQAQEDYRRYLELDPQAQTRMQREILLFQQSRYAGAGQRQVVRYASPGELTVPPNGMTVPRVPPPPVVPRVARTKAEIADVYFESAQDAFGHRRYADAVRWAGYAHDAMPQSRVHALLAQALFARGEYAAAAQQARAAVAMGPPIDWQTLYAFYDYDVALYAKQLRTLEDQVTQFPSSADGRFLLGYQYLILGQTPAAHDQLAIALTLEPADTVAKDLLARAGVEVVADSLARRPTDRYPPAPPVPNPPVLR